MDSPSHFDDRSPGQLPQGSQAEGSVPSTRDDQPYQREWTLDEDSLVRLWYPIEGAVGLVERLDRTIPAIHQRAHRLNVDPPWKWGSDEIAIVLQYYPVGGSVLVQQHLPTRRTKKAISLVAKRKGLSAPNARGASFAPGHVPVNRVSWSDAEDAVIRRYVGHKPLKQLHAEHFKGNPYTRTYASVAQRISALGLSTPRLPAVSRGATPADRNPGRILTQPMLDEIRSMVFADAPLAKVIERYPNIHVRLLREHYDDFLLVRAQKQIKASPGPSEVSHQNRRVNEELGRVLQLLSHGGLPLQSRLHAPSDDPIVSAEQTALATTLKLVAAMRAGAALRPALEDAILYASDVPSDLVPPALALCIRFAAAHAVGDAPLVLRMLEASPTITAADQIAAETGLMVLSHLDAPAFVDYVATSPWVRGRDADLPASSALRWCQASVAQLSSNRSSHDIPKAILAQADEVVLSTLHLAIKRGDQTTYADMLSLVDTRMRKSVKKRIADRLKRLTSLQVFALPGGIRYAIRTN